MNVVILKQLKYDEILSFSQIEFNDQNRPEVDNKYRKALYFLAREGLFKTFRKIKSKKNERVSIIKKYTLLKLKYNNKTYGNLSIQTSGNAEDFVILNNFFEIDADARIEAFMHEKQKFNQYEYLPKDFTYQLPSVAMEKQQFGDYETGVFVYGLGDYSRVYISNEIKSLNKICCVDYIIDFAKLYAEDFNFEHYKIVPQQSYGFLKQTKYPLTIIATYHSDHSRLAKEIFDINPNAFIFIEKPPCVTLEDLDILLELYFKKATIEIGYNRRYIPINQKIRKLYRKQIKVVNISVKEIKINKNHWYFWSNQGTRITGNLTHWIDLATYWIDEIPSEMTMLASTVEDETIGLSILYDKGSLVNISVSDKGNSLRGVQEAIEIRTGEETILINDYISTTEIGINGRLKTTKNLKRNKGHETMYNQLIHTYQTKSFVKYSPKDLVYTTIITFYAAKMFRENIRHMKLYDVVDTYMNKL